jgi:hypothetical protein
VRSSGFQHESRFHRTFSRSWPQRFEPGVALQAEIAALRHQIACSASAPRRLRLKQSDRFLWIFYSSVWQDWRRWLRILKPDAFIRWHRSAFRSILDAEVGPKNGTTVGGGSRRDLIRRMSRANSCGEHLESMASYSSRESKSASSTVGKYLRRTRKPPSQTWRTFLTNHLTQTASMDFFTVPTATFRVLFVFLVLSHTPRGKKRRNMGHSIGGNSPQIQSRWPQATESDIIERRRKSEESYSTTGCESAKIIHVTDNRARR